MPGPLSAPKRRLHNREQEMEVRAPPVMARDAWHCQNELEEYPGGWLASALWGWAGSA